jgi:hypothetical protein
MDTVPSAISVPTLASSLGSLQTEAHNAALLKA